jgi:hypothetical protein
MRRFLALSSLLFLALAVVLGVVIVLQRKQPLPERFAILHLYDCELPCWIGIVPGVTTLDDAEKRVRSVFAAPHYTIEIENELSYPERRLHLSLRGEPLFTVGLGYRDSGSISSVSILFNVHKEAIYRDYSFAELHGLIGAPTFLHITYVSPAFEIDSTFTYRKPGGYVIIGGFDRDVAVPLKMRIVRQLFFTDSIILDPESVTNGFLKWRGLMMIQRYGIEYGIELCSRIEC